MQDPVAEIKNKLSIEDVVAPYVQLKRAGKYLKAPCPFHQEKTPSFFVNTERQIAYCFSCQKGGDMFVFIEEIEGVDFRGALEILADKASVELPKFSGKQGASKDLKDRLKAACLDANNFFIQKLWDTRSGSKVLDYLHQRGLTDDSIKMFEIGFSLDEKDELYRHLLDKKHEKDDILASTLAIARDSESSQIVDRFRLRLMFPIADTQASVVAFGGRALKKGDNPKYLNSPEYLLYNKSAILYNLSRAKNAIREQDNAIVVEGYFDVVMSHQAGVENVVASCGTALTEGQFKLLKRYTKKVSLAFDSDKAGQEALLRAVHTAQPLGLELFVIEIPEGKDAADAVKEDPALWQVAVEKRKPYLDYFLRKWQQSYDLATSEGKRHFTDAFLDVLKGVTHPVERDHYLKELSVLVGTPAQMLYDYLGQLSSRRQGSVKPKQEKAQKSKQERLLSYFTGLLLAFPQVFFEAWEKLGSSSLLESRARHLGLIKPLSRIEESTWNEFRENFGEYLKHPDCEFDGSSVYKQVCHEYNSQGELGAAFYADLEHGDQLQKMAFEAEMKNPDLNQIEDEFEKLITLLYLEFTASTYG